MAASHAPVALVTGASRGIGKALAESFSRHGYRLALNFNRSAREAEATAERIRGSGGEALTLKADVRDTSQVRSMVESVVAQWGRIDVLVNNAGVARDRTLLKMSDEEWNEVIRVNLTGAFHCLRECARLMSLQKEGSILNLGSMAGVRGVFGAANYAASKAGLIALTKSAAREFGRFNVRVNAILPGFHVTGMNGAFWETRKEEILSEHVLGRLTDLSELTEFSVVVAGLRSVSGQVFCFDSRLT